MPDSLRYFVRKQVLIAFVILAGIAATAGQAKASLLWTWTYSGPDISAAGTFTTVDTPDASGFYLITAITGTRNGETITGLQPTGTPIPGNEPFNVDNLVRVGVSQLTGDGFGYSTSGGNFASPFFADFLPTPGYLEVFSAPPFIPGSDNLGPEDSELEITFSAAPVPEPKTALLLIVGFGLLGLSTLRGRSDTIRFHVEDKYAKASGDDDLRGAPWPGGGPRAVRWPGGGSVKP